MKHLILSKLRFFLWNNCNAQLWNPPIAFFALLFKHVVLLGANKTTSAWFSLSVGHSIKQTHDVGAVLPVCQPEVTSAWLCLFYRLGLLLWTFPLPFCCLGAIVTRISNIQIFFPQGLARHTGTHRHTDFSLHCAFYSRLWGSRTLWGIIDAAWYLTVGLVLWGF